MTNYNLPRPIAQVEVMTINNTGPISLRRSNYIFDIYGNPLYELSEWSDGEGSIVPLSRSTQSWQYLYSSGRKYSEISRLESDFSADGSIDVVGEDIRYYDGYGQDIFRSSSSQYFGGTYNTTYTYGINGRLIYETVQSYSRWSFYDSRISYLYDIQGKLLSSINNAIYGRTVTNYTYDTNGYKILETSELDRQLDGVIDSFSSIRWTYTYDSSGNKIAETSLQETDDNADGIVDSNLLKAWTYTYDSNGNKIAETSLQETDNNVDGIVDSNLLETWTYTYDSSGNKIAETSLQETDNNADDILDYGSLSNTNYIDNNLGVNRFFDPVTGNHFYTGNTDEVNSLIHNLSSTYQYEGIGFGSPLPMLSDFFTVPVYRFFNPLLADHFYTSSDEEKNSTIANLVDYISEGVGFLAYRQGSGYGAEVYRFFNRVTGDHFYTVSTAEKDFIMANSPESIYEGVAFNAVK